MAGAEMRVRVTDRRPPWATIASNTFPNNRYHRSQRLKSRIPGPPLEQTIVALNRVLSGPQHIGFGLITRRAEERMPFHLRYNRMRRNSR